MKFKVFDLKKPENTEAKNGRLENLLFGICILCFVILLAVQVVLVVPGFRDRLNFSDKSIGLPLNSDEYLYNQGQITLRMLDEQPDPTVYILLNGDSIGSFDNTVMNLSVKDGDVIEIDGSKSLTGHIVTVDSISSNINKHCKNATANVENNIKLLVKVQVN